METMLLLKSVVHSSVSIKTDVRSNFKPILLSVGLILPLLYCALILVDLPILATSQNVWHSDANPLPEAIINEYTIPECRRELNPTGGTPPISKLRLRKRYNHHGSRNKSIDQKKSGKKVISLNRHKRIIYGIPVDQDKYKWMAHLTIIDNLGRKTVCGGSIIARDLILTAGQCVASGQCITQIIVRLSRWKIGLEMPEGQSMRDNIGGSHEYQQVYRVGSICIHENYEQGADIAILKLRDNEKITYDAHTQPICLPHPLYDGSDALNRRGDNDCYATGWGKTLSGSMEEERDLLHRDEEYRPDDNPLKEMKVFPSTCHIQQFGETNKYTSCYEEFDNFSHEFYAYPCYGDAGGPVQCKSKIQPVSWERPKFNTSTQTAIISRAPFNCDSVNWKRTQGIYTDLIKMKHHTYDMIVALRDGSCRLPKYLLKIREPPLTKDEICLVGSVRFSDEGPSILAPLKFLEPLPSQRNDRK